ncbi:MAG TPA: cyclic nucleotide-binding domain-containing protein, partial [Solirubrobacteraceae bacterium]|nr:cyclic nucleotide-binding domain-containing protein [Solirubrobacteraceae bacterium]
MARAGYAKQSFLESLSEPERGALLEIGHRRRWQRGDVLVHAGDRADSAIVVLSGLVKIHKLAAEGADVLLALCGPGDLLGEIGAVREAVRAASATAVDLV